jgi:hypothetical protein
MHKKSPNCSPPPLHHCHILETGNESYRFKNSSTQTRKEPGPKRYPQLESIINIEKRWLKIQ